MPNLTPWLPRKRPPRPAPAPVREMYAPAWEGATRHYDMPFTAMHDPRTLPMDLSPRFAQQQQQNDLAQFAMQREAGRNEVNTPPGTYFGQDTLEITGLPSIARGVGHLRDGEPGEALPEMALGGLGVFGMVGGGGGARTAPPRIPRIPRIPRTLPQIAEEARLPNAPARLPGRATDGSVLPIRPPEPIRQSMVGGSDDLAEAARMQPATPPGIIRNPNESQLATLAERGDEMKYVMDTEGNVYAFSAADMHHNQAMRALRDSGVRVRPLGPGAEVTDPDAAGFIWRNSDGSFVHEDANMRESGPFSAFQRRMQPDAGGGQAGRQTREIPIDQAMEASGSPFTDDVWEIGGPQITVEEVRAAMARGARRENSFSHQSDLDWTRQDHIDRMATLARDGWSEPLELTPYGINDDGLHRLGAAIARGDQRIRVSQRPLSAAEQRELTADPRQLEAEHRARTQPDGGSARAEQFSRGMQQLRDEGFDIETPLYHATGATFDNFDLAQAGARTGGERAIFLTTSPAVADSYLPGAFGRTEQFQGAAADLGDGVSRAYSEGANVRPVYVRPENFERWDFGGAELTAADLQRVITEARANGAPGVAISNVRDAGQYSAGPIGNPNRPAHIVIVFDPKNVTPRFPRVGEAGYDARAPGLVTDRAAASQSGDAATPGPTRAQPNAGPPRPPPRTLPRRPTQ